MTQDKLNETLLGAIWTITIVAVAGSLFYSEVMVFVPCELCWVQRIFMYPLTIIYGVALWKRKLEIALPGLILSIIGICFSIYHYSMQKLPALQEAGSMCRTVPCNLQYVNYFGFITIPFLAGLSFLSVITLHFILIKHQRRQTNEI